MKGSAISKTKAFFILYPSSFLLSVWRRGWDSNPRNPFGLNGFRDRPIQPLSHLSAMRIVNSKCWQGGSQVRSGFAACDASGNSNTCITAVLGMLRQVRLIFLSKNCDVRGSFSRGDGASVFVTE